jgi:hypothetical protein
MMITHKQLPDRDRSGVKDPFHLKRHGDVTQLYSSLCPKLLFSLFVLLKNKNYLKRCYDSLYH